jgi:type I site-specific restriction endonuclease
MNISLPNLNLPSFNFRVENDSIFDSIRKKWVALTPEEWVRQNFLTYLLLEKGYPKSLIKVEQSIKAFDQARRCDAVIYTNEIKPLAILECKKPDVKINEKTFQQIALYNTALNAPYLIITNGLDHYCCKIELTTSKTEFLDHIPGYKELSQTKL